MKNLLVAILVLASISGPAQNQLLSINGEISVKDASMEEVFVKTRQWYLSTFKDANQAFILNDKHTGELTAKGVTTIPVTYIEVVRKNRKWVTRFNASFVAQDDKCQFEFTNFECQKGPGAKFYRLFADKKDDHYIEAMKQGVRDEFSRVVQSFKVYMNN